MSWNRREVLGGLGIASASTLGWALGCGAPATTVRSAQRPRDEVRGWLRDAVERLATAYPTVHVLAVTRLRTTAAIDVAGTGMARARRDGVVLRVGDASGASREQVTAELTRPGVLAAVHALTGASDRRASIDFGPAPEPPAPLSTIDDNALKNRVGHVQRNDHASSSRLVYAAAMIDVDDVSLWSLAPGHDREHHVRRVRQHAVRAAWNGTRPVVSEVARGWTGELDDQLLDVSEVTGATTRALQLMTPGAFPEGMHSVVLEPSVVATLIDACVRGALTSRAARRPEVSHRLGLGAMLGSPLLTLIDDPTTRGAYGRYAFDDAGAVAAPVTLIDAGRIAGRLDRARRAGHVGVLEASASHLRVVPGNETAAQVQTGAGWLVEGASGAAYDPSRDRVIIGASRARELRQGSETGRVYADVDLVGSLGALLASITGMSTEARTSVIRDEVAGEPSWRSISTPWIRMSGFVRARRRPT